MKKLITGIAQFQKHSYPDNKELNIKDHLEEMTQENILQQMRNLETHPSVAMALAAGKLEIHGWLYDIGKGEVNCYDPGKEEFVSVSDRYAHLHPEILQ